jgi:hypothetical protein
MWMSCQRTSSLSRTVLDQTNIRPPVRWSTSKRKTSRTQQHCWVASTSGNGKACKSIRSKLSSSSNWSLDFGLWSLIFELRFSNKRRRPKGLKSKDQSPKTKTSTSAEQAEPQRPVKELLLAPPAHTKPGTAHF